MVDDSLKEIKHELERLYEEISNYSGGAEEIRKLQGRVNHIDNLRYLNALSVHTKSGVPDKQFPSTECFSVSIVLHLVQSKWSLRRWQWKDTKRTGHFTYPSPQMLLHRKVTYIVHYFT